MANYNWDIDDTIIMLMPSFLRKPRHFAWLKAILNPIKNLYAGFLVYRDEQIYEAYLTGQTIQLERLLNDLFDNSLRRIYIVHSLDLDIILFLDEEAQPLEDVVLYLDSEAEPLEDLTLYRDLEDAGALPQDFRVIAPATLTSQQTEFEKRIDKYKLVQKTYDIVFV